MLRTALLLGSALQLLVACDRWSLIVNSDGVLSITIVSDDGFSGHHFRVRARQADGSTQTLEIPASGRLSSSALESGMVELTLESPEGCIVSGPNPQSLMVGEGPAASVTFDVSCGE